MISYCYAYISNWNQSKNSAIKFVPKVNTPPRQCIKIRKSAFSVLEGMHVL